jgi:hypothetical protein
LIDTSLVYPLALSTQGWSKAGVNQSSLKLITGSTTLKQGVLPTLRLGAFPIPQVPGVAGVPMTQLAGLEMNVDGVLGAGLLANFRVTLVDRGRTMWLEAAPPALADSPTDAGTTGGTASLDDPDPARTEEPPSSAPAPKPTKAPAPAAKPAPSKPK